MRHRARSLRGIPSGAALWVWALSASLATAQERERPPRPAPEPEERCSPAETRACTVLKLAGYLTPERPAPQPAGETRRVYRIGLLGHDDVTLAAARVLPGKNVDGATVQVVRVESLAAVEGRADELCDLLYVAQSIDSKVLARVVSVHAKDPMPIVCERPGFAAAGGSIQLFAEKDDLRFEINAEALQKQGVRASPQLLKLSRRGPVP